MLILPYFMNIVKYQSLGNDFVLLDWLDQPDNNIDAKFIKLLCDRHYAIGADGVLIIKKNQNQTEAMIFNADGSYGYKCFNGLRCVAHYLVTIKNYPQNLEIFMGDKLMQCTVQDKITINVGSAHYQTQHKLNNLTGHIVSVGNPHFVILKKTTLKWLEKNGVAIENHKTFPDRTNIEFVWPTDKNNYNILVHERGCGITLACGSGAAAVMQTLYQLQKINRNEKIFLHMQGGVIESHLDNNNNIIQIASANMVFRANFNG